MVTYVEPPPEPTTELSDPHALLSAFLDFYRQTILRKLEGLPEAELRGSHLPTGWTPLELLKHLAGVERRWFRWGFAGEDVGEPWLEQGSDGGWHVHAGESFEDVRALFLDECERSRRIIASARVEDQARGGGRFDPGELPTLGWILCHVLQEYARHAGHLDIARELADGAVGE
jgi:hypothetical protein